MLLKGVVYRVFQGNWGKNLQNQTWKQERRFCLFFFLNLCVWFPITPSCHQPVLLLQDSFKAGESKSTDTGGFITSCRRWWGWGMRHGGGAKERGDWILVLCLNPQNHRKPGIFLHGRPEPLCWSQPDNSIIPRWCNTCMKENLNL